MAAPKLSVVIPAYNEEECIGECVGEVCSVMDRLGQTYEVVVVNDGKIAVTSDKRETKLYMRHSGYPHGLKAESLGHLLDRRPDEVIRRAVKGMLPHNRLGAQQLTKLKVYAGPEHPHQAQRPEPLARRGAQ